MKSQCQWKCWNTTWSRRTRVTATSGQSCKRAKWIRLRTLRNFNRKKMNSCCEFSLNSFKTTRKPLCANPETSWVKDAMATVPQWVYLFVKIKQTKKQHSQQWWKANYQSNQLFFLSSLTAENKEKHEELNWNSIIYCILISLKQWNGIFCTF